MENHIYNFYLKRMRKTFELEGGFEARKQLVEEMKGVAKTGFITIDEVYTIYFSVMLSKTGIYGT